MDGVPHTGCRPYGMCGGGVLRSGIGRAVYALSTEQLREITPKSDRGPTVTQEDPALFEEARLLIDACGPAS